MLSRLRCYPMRPCGQIQYSLPDAPVTSGIPAQMACGIFADGKAISEEHGFGFAGCLGHLPLP